MVSLLPRCKKGCDHCKDGLELKSVLQKLQQKSTRGRDFGGGVRHIVNRYKWKEGEYEGFEEDESRFGGGYDDESDEENSYHKSSFVSASSLKRKKRSNAGEGFVLVGGNGDGFQAARQAIRMPSNLSAKDKLDILQRNEELSKNKPFKPPSARSRLRAILDNDD